MICKLLGIRGGEFESQEGKKIKWMHLIIDEESGDIDDSGGNYQYGSCPVEISVPAGLQASIDREEICLHCGQQIELIYDFSPRGGKAILRDIILR